MNLFQVFFPHEGADSEEVEKVREVFNLCDKETEPLSEKFIAKYELLEARGGIPKEKLFRATVDAMELDGIRLLAGSEVAPEVPIKETTAPAKQKVSLKELFTQDSSTNKE